MKIAIPTKGNQIDNHFGHCDFFTLIEVDEKEDIKSREELPSSTVCGCKSGLAGDLATRGVELLLAAGIGQGAINKLKAHQIEVIPGFTGSVDEVLEKWKAKDFGKEIKICTDHQHSCSH